MKEKKINISSIKYSMRAKAIAIIVLCVTVFLTVAGMCMGVAMWDMGIYNMSQEKKEDSMLEEYASEVGADALLLYLFEGGSNTLYNYGDCYNAEVEIFNGLELYKTAGVDTKDNLTAYYRTYLLGDILDPFAAGSIADSIVNEDLASIIQNIESQLGNVSSDEMYTETTAAISSEVYNDFCNYQVEVIVYVDEAFPVADTFAYSMKVVDGIYVVKPFVWPVTAIAFVLSVALLVVLLPAVGYRKGSERAIVCGTARIPYDVFGLIYICVATPLFIEGMDYYTYGFGGNEYSYLVFGALLLGISGMLAVAFALDFSVRFKTRTLWGNTLMAKCWKKIDVIPKVKVIGKWTFKWMLKLVNAIPIIWKGLALYAGISMWWLIMAYSWQRDLRLAMWTIANVVVLVILVYCYYMFAKLRLASKELGNGNLKYKVNTNLWMMEFKEMGENLNAIGTGMECAIEEKMKSERMKTELISNVSHDIKTPLTSIVNYADLISKEDTENVKIQEYSQILLRQADRLKRLTEDLVHASKVSSGNVDVEMVPCNIAVLLFQAIGEYEEKLESANLRIVLKQPKEPIVVQADGRHLWRVFDNLFNNIYKYAQDGTRVYLTLKECNGKAEIEFKNISKYELNISENELMERFVRGDQSRHSEGNGLGLSIAKSLMEVQGGMLELMIDGDLFKVTVKI